MLHTKDEGYMPVGFGQYNLPYAFQYKPTLNISRWFNIPESKVLDIVFSDKKV